MTANTDSNDKDALPGSAARPLRDGIDTIGGKAGDAADITREKAAQALDAAKGGLDMAREAIGGAYASGVDKAGDLYATSRDRASDAYAAARDKVRLAGDTASDTFDASPIAALLGGLALGVVIGGLLPRTEREGRLLGGVNAKLGGLAQGALEAAKGAGQAKLAEIGLTPDKARESFQSLVEGALAAATSAGEAAVDSTRAQAKTAPAK